METLLNLDWTSLIPLIILLTGALKDLGAFKKMKNEIVNLIVGAVIIGLVFGAQAIGFDWLTLAPFEAIAVLIINPLIYDKIVKPTLDFLRGRG